MRVYAGLLSVLTLWAMAGSGLAQDPPAEPASEPERTADIQAIDGLNAAFIKAYDAKDAKALGELFTAEAEVEDEDGDITRGREAIVARFNDYFQSGESGTVSIAPGAIRFLGTDLATEDGVVAIDSGSGVSPRTNRYSAIFTRQGGRWLQARIRDEPSEEYSTREHMQELSWMIGEWVNESDDATVVTSCKFSKDGNFLMREFDIKVGTQIALSGTQRITWDSQQKQFRLWIFDTGGSFGEGTMARDGDDWVLKVRGVRSDGQSVTATSKIQIISEDRARWQILDRTLGGVAVPDPDAYYLVRKPPAPGQ